MALSWILFFLIREINVAQANAPSANMSQKCLKDVGVFLKEINQEKPMEYAVLMYDAYGKLGSNVKGGNVNQPGLLQQCRSIIGPSFSGLYCQVFLRQGAVEYFVGICVPNSCGEDDVRRLVQSGVLQMNHLSLIPPVPPLLNNQSSRELVMTHCLPNAVAPDAYDVTCMAVCCIMLVIPLVATLFTAIKRSSWRRASSPAIEFSLLKNDPNFYGTLPNNGLCRSNVDGSSADENGGSSWLCVLQSQVFEWLQRFSLQTTSKGILNTTSSNHTETYSSLNGIRVLSLFWIICGHSAQFPVINNLDNYETWKQTVVGNPVYVLTISGPVFLAVDTFLLLGGLLSARSLLSSIKHADDKLSLELVGNFLFKRIKRIQPLHLFTMCLTVSLISEVRWGPYWFPFLDTLMDCKSYWWANLLLISNLLPVHDICIPWTWYLSLDFQCYITTPLLICCYRLNRNLFHAVAGALLLMSTVASTVLTASLKLPVFQPSTMTSDDYVLQYYVKPYTRYGPFLIGFLTGIRLTKKEVLCETKRQAALGWFCCLSVLAMLVGFAYLLRETPAHLSLPHAVYQGLHRSVWALTVSWIILACEGGYGGWINQFLSGSFWVPLSNISFACYLIHPVFIILYNGLQETPIHYTDMNFMYLFLGHVVLTVAVGCALTMLVEKPYLFLKHKSS